MTESLLNRVRAEIALVREELSAANLAGDLSKARALVVSALQKVDSVVGHLASVVADEIEEIIHDVEPGPTEADEDED